MTIRFLSVGNEERQKLLELKKYAEEHVMSFDELIKIFAKIVSPAGDRPEHTLFIPEGFKVVFSIEEQKPGKCRHLSVSVDKEGKLPSVGHVTFLMNILGFQKPMCDCIICLEEIAENHHAVSVMEDM